MAINRLLVTGALIFLAIPSISSALVVDINGSRLEPKKDGDPCIDITGDYPGFSIVPSEVDKTPQICFDNRRQNHLEIHHVTFVATGSTPTAPAADGDNSTAPSASEVVITFTHEFPPGPNGVVTTRANLFGFFSTATGVGVAKGNKIKFLGFFSQENNYDVISAPFEYAVGDTIDSGVFDFSAKKKYLISGPRALKGVLSFSFNRSGDKLTLPLATGVKIDRGSRFIDRVDSLTTDVNQ